MPLFETLLATQRTTAANVLYTWGTIGSGQLGNGFALDALAPIIGDRSWIAADTGIAIDSDYKLWTWGRGTEGYLGDGTLINRSSPVQIGNSSWIAVTSFPRMAIRSDGALFAWGENNTGLLAQYDDPRFVTPSSPYPIVGESWTSVATGFYHALALNNNGALYTWGTNSYGELGDGTNINKSSPVQLGTSSWTAVSAGAHQSAAIRSDGALFIWGRNTNGQLGDGTTVNKSSPVQIGTSSWTAVSVGKRTTAAIRSDGALFTWGYGFWGALGDGTYTSKSSPVLIGTSSWSAVRSGAAYYSDHVLAIRSDGALFAWGDNTYGQVGDGTSGNKKPSPVQIGTSSWTAISAGGPHSTAIRSGGALFAWGYNSYGQLGDGTSGYGPPSAKSSPVQIGTSSWIALPSSQGNFFTGAVRSDNTLWMWGFNAYWILNNGYSSFNGPSSPVQVGLQHTPTNVSWTAFSSGGAEFNGFTLGIDPTGKMFAWGGINAGGGVENIYYGAAIASSPVQIGTSSWVAIGAGSVNFNSWGGLPAIAIRSDGALFTWGRNDLGQLGQNDLIYRVSPTQLGTSSWTAVSSNQPSVLAIRSDGALFAWGRNNFGQLGDGTTVDKSSPVLIGTSSWTTVSAGVYQSAAIRSDGRLFTWGRNNYGQLGDGTTVNKSSPVQIGTSSWTAVAFASQSVAIRSDGSLFNWGLFNPGQGILIGISSPILLDSGSWASVGGSNLRLTALRADGILQTRGVWNTSDDFSLGRKIVYTIPLPGSQVITEATNGWVNLGSSWAAVASGTAHKLAIKSDGTLFAWGSNTRGQQGTNTNILINTPSPVQVGTSSWIAVSAGSDSSAAIRSDGRLFTWGRNNYGQLGDGTTVDKSSPVQIGTSSWTAVSINLTTAAIRSDGALFTWGSGNAGQLGDGTTVSKSSPVLIGTSSWTAVFTGGIFNAITAAIRSDGRLFTWGSGNAGQLGDGTTVSKSSPVLIGTSSWTAVAFGASNVMALRSDGALFTWGSPGTQLQLGDGTTVARSSPVQVGTSSWTAIDAIGIGGFRSTSVAVRSDGKLFAWGSIDLTTAGISPAIAAPNSPVLISSESWRTVGIKK